MATTTPPVWYPEIAIPKGVSVDTLKKYGYGVFTEAISVPAGYTAATLQQIQDWFATLPDPVTYANRAIDTVISHITSTTTATQNTQSIPEPGTAAYDTYINNLRNTTGATIGGSDLLSVLKDFFDKILQPFRDIATTFSGLQADINAVTGYIGDAITKLKNFATDTGDLIKWIDQPATLERGAAIIIGAVLLFLGVNAIIMSFIDVRSVGQTVKTVAEVAAV